MKKLLLLFLETFELFDQINLEFRADPHTEFNRNTVEFLGIWEQIHNPNFNYGEFAIIRSQAGLNSYKLSVKEWVEKTNAIGLMARAGRYGGTYAYKDIAFEFGMWISPEFKIYLIKEFERLKPCSDCAASLK